jgi:hypothetical protein
MERSLNPEIAPRTGKCVYVDDRRPPSVLPGILPVAYPIAKYLLTDSEIVE